MKILSYFIIFISLFTYAFTNSENLKPSNIHVLIEKDANEALLEVCGPYYIFNPCDSSRVSSGILGKRFIVRATQSGIKWGQEFPGIHQIVIAPRSKETTFLLNGIQYDGALAVYKVKNKIHLVNQIDVESYLKSILTTQFYYPLAHEAMAAIAIAARTTAYFQIEKNKNSFWHVDTTNQKYEGSALITPSSSIQHAIDSTKNLILLNQKSDTTLPFYAI